MAKESEFGGLHRGIVVDNNDPKKLGRVKIQVQSAYGEQPVENLPWAWPCLGYGGMQGMYNYSVPEVGAGAWVAFQHKDGQPDTTYPVCVGFWQAEKERPDGVNEQIKDATEDAHYYKEMKTTSGHSVLMSDKPDEEFIEIKDKDGNLIRFDDKEGFVRVQDKSGSFIFMKDGNVEIHAANNMKLTANKIDLN